jgi:hypothetical protein
VHCVCSTDNLDFVKERATKAIYKLLIAKPEGEQVGDVCWGWGPQRAARQPPGGWGGGWGVGGGAAGPGLGAWGEGVWVRTLMAAGQLTVVCANQHLHILSDLPDGSATRQSPSCMLSLCFTLPDCAVKKA